MQRHVQYASTTSPFEINLPVSRSRVKVKLYSAGYPVAKNEGPEIRVSLSSVLSLIFFKLHKMINDYLTRQNLIKGVV